MNCFDSVDLSNAISSAISTYVFTCSEAEDGRGMSDFNLNETDLSQEDRVTIEKECIAFVFLVRDKIVDLDPMDVGSNFVYSRNGHGTGFWDMDLENDLGNELHEAASSFGEAGIFLDISESDPKKAYISFIRSSSLASDALLKKLLSQRMEIECALRERNDFDISIPNKKTSPRSRL